MKDKGQQSIYNHQGFVGQYSTIYLDAPPLSSTSVLPPQQLLLDPLCMWTWSQWYSIQNLALLLMPDTTASVVADIALMYFPGQFLGQSSQVSSWSWVEIKSWSFPGRPQGPLLGLKFMVPEHEEETVTQSVAPTALVPSLMAKYFKLWHVEHRVMFHLRRQSIDWLSWLSSGRATKALF